MPYEGTLAARFAAKTERQPNGCLLWTGSTDDCGYGMLRVDRRRVRRAHIVAWLLSTGDWPTLCVLHTCDTPGCVEHAHHFEGTRADNAADRDAKGRHVTLSGGRRTLPAADVAAIRAARGAVTARALAARYGISGGYVSSLQTGKARGAA